MKKNTIIKTFIYIMTLVLGILLSSSYSFAGYVELPEDSSIVITVNTTHQSFDEALMLGLQLLDQSEVSNTYGIIEILLNDCCISAKIRITDLIKADKMDSSEFVRKYVKFI